LLVPPNGIGAPTETRPGNRNRKDLTGHGGAPERISDTSSDLSQAFIAGIGAHRPNATLTFDRYRSKTKMINIIYFIAGKLPDPSPYVAHPI
jgi:hypothetical protein